MDLIDSSHRPSTRSVYGHYWDRWLLWCQSHRIDPIRPSDVSLANFLAEILVRRKLSVSAMKGYRSAITSTIAQLGGSISDDSHNPFLLRDLVRGASLKAARVPRRIPAWDLFLVLAALRRPPFEPLRDISLRHLTWKTAFLLTLASGRRGSEVHAISGASPDIAFERSGALSLRFLPEFLAKNQTPGSVSPVLIIPALTSILARDDEDRMNCPVRAVSAYLERTKFLRKATHRRLFISLNPDHPSDISLSSLSRWLREVIKVAYSASEVALNPRAHEIRAWASSLAFAHSVPMNTILDAAFWKNEGTFIQFYLRDARRSRQDGSFGVGAAVVAQSAVANL